MEDEHPYRSNYLDANEIINIIDCRITRALIKNRNELIQFAEVIHGELLQVRRERAELREEQARFLQQQQRIERTQAIHVLDDHPEKRPFRPPRIPPEKPYPRPRIPVAVVQDAIERLTDNPWMEPRDIADDYGLTTSQLEHELLKVKAGRLGDECGRRFAS